MTWKPAKASGSLEADMDAKGVAEQDRDELRRFAEVLRRRKTRMELDLVGGGPLPPLPGMFAWLKGEDATGS